MTMMNDEVRAISEFFWELGWRLRGVHTGHGR
jgi:hypothetical protein